MLAQRHGAPPELALIMSASALTESNGDSEARGDNGRSLGLWQINDVHRLRAEDRLDPDYAASWMLANHFGPRWDDVQARHYDRDRRALWVYLASEKPAGYRGPDDPGWGSEAARRFQTQWPRVRDLPGQEDTPMARLVDCRDRFPFEGCELSVRALSQIAEVVYHHGASRTPEPTPEDELALLEAYHRLHVAKTFCVLAYHLAVGPSGTVYYCNNLNLVTYHATTANPTSVGIVFLGDYSHEAPSPEMCSAAVQARQWVAQQLGRDDLPYRGHKDIGGTACPGAWWPEPGRALLASWGQDEPEDAPPSEAQRIAELESYIGAVTAHIITPSYQELKDELARPPGLRRWTPLAKRLVARLEPHVRQEA